MIRILLPESITAWWGIRWVQFYGYVQDGIFQNQPKLTIITPASWTSKPGDIRYKDLNGDQKITDKDRDFY